MLKLTLMLINALYCVMNLSAVFSVGNLTDRFHTVYTLPTLLYVDPPT